MARTGHTMARTELNENSAPKEFVRLSRLMQWHEYKYGKKPTGLQNTLVNIAEKLTKKEIEEVIALWRSKK
jgi:hypothetical protein